MITKQFTGQYERRGFGVVGNKNIIHCEHPEIGRVYDGTINVLLNEDIHPPYEDELRKYALKRNPPLYADGNHICPSIRVQKINSNRISGFLYRGGHMQMNHIEIVTENDIGDFWDTGLNTTIELIFLENNECASILDYIRNNNPKGNEFWINLHKLSEKIFQLGYSP